MRIRTTTRSVLAAWAALCLAGAATAAEPVGFLAVARGAVSVSPGGAGHFVAAAADDSVALGDVVRTGRRGLAKLVLLDDSSLTLDEETELRIDAAVVGSGAGDASRLELLGGQVRSRVGRAFGGTTHLELGTPTAVIGVKGTEWLTWYRSAATWIYVAQGVVSARNRDPAVRGELDVAAGQWAVVRRGAPPRLVQAPTGLRPVEEPRSPAFPAAMLPDPALTGSDRSPENRVPKPGEALLDDDRMGPLGVGPGPAAPTDPGSQPQGTPSLPVGSLKPVRGVAGP